MRLEELLRENREGTLRFAAEHGARDVRVFGSVAHRETNARSGIELIVVKSTARRSTLAGSVSAPILVQHALCS